MNTQHRRTTRRRFRRRLAVFRRTGVALCLLVFGTASGAWAEPGDEQERLQLADGLYSRGMFDLASREYEAILRNFPKSAKADSARFRMAESYSRLGKADLAEGEFRRVFADYPASEFRFKAGYRLAELLLQKNKDKEGIEALNALLKANPPADIESAALYSLGDALRRIGKPDEAAGAYEQVRQKHAKSRFLPFALLKLAQLYASDEPGRSANLSAGREARQQKALGFFEEAAKSGSDRVAAESVFQMAEMYSRQKDFRKSAEQYRKLLGTWPKDERSAEARLQAAWAEHNAGFYAEAAKLADLALQGKAPGAAAEPTGDARAEWLYLKANCERQLMQNDAAVKTYAELLAKHPRSAFCKAACYETALVYYKMGRFEEAVAQAGKVELTADVTRDVYWLLAESYSALKKPAEAIQYYRLIVRDFPKSDLAVEALYRLAHHLQAQSEFKEASQHYNRLATEHADHKLAPQALFASAFCLAKAETHAEAVRDWGALIRKYPGDTLVEPALYQKALGEIRLARDGDAVNTLQELIKRFPQSESVADSHYWLGVLLQQGGKAAEAEAAFRESLKAKPKDALAAEAEFRLGTALRQQGKDAEAAALFRKVLSLPVREKFPLPTLQWLAEYSHEQKDFKGCIAAAQVLVERSKDASWLQTGWALAGRGQLGAGDSKQAEEAFKKALAAKANTPFAAEAALRLGDLALAANDHRKSSEFYTKVAETASGDDLLALRARAQAGLGWSSRAAGDWEGAARYLMTVAILYDDPDLVPRCLSDAAEAFTRMGKKDEADKALKELGQRYPDSEYAKRTAGK